MEKSKNAPSLRVLRQFGWTMLIGFTVLAFLFIKKRNVVWAIASETTGVALLTMTFLSSSGATLFYRGWMTIGETMGKISSMIILFFVFYAILTPLAIVMRLGGRDILRRFDKGRDQKSFWMPVPVVRPGDHQHLS